MATAELVHASKVIQVVVETATLIVGASEMESKDE